jgi:guanylate kinase
LSAEDWSHYPGKLFVVSGPSGSGKSTLVRRAIGHPRVRARLSVSATTRPVRPDERPGIDYHFFARDDFEAQRGDFLEWAEVHGNLYGTPAAPVRESLAAGECVLLEIDVQGALQVKRRIPAAILVFINVPGFEALEARLRTRGTDSESAIQRRLTNARLEIAQAGHYDVQLLNDDLDRAVEALVALMVQHGCGG